MSNLLQIFVESRLNCNHDSGRSGRESKIVTAETGLKHYSYSLLDVKSSDIELTCCNPDRFYLLFSGDAHVYCASASSIKTRQVEMKWPGSTKQNKQS
jgi:hypothetical protein